MKITRYMPIVRVEHEDDGTIISVEVDWDDSLSLIEQEIDDEEAERLSEAFDHWLQSQSQWESHQGWVWIES